MATKTPQLTPAMRQYLQFKQQYPDYVLFFRMGDFYELFFEDAVIAHKVLGLTLVRRCNAGGDIPMAGVPFHAVEVYLRKLIAVGHKAAICEQAEAEGTIKHDVTRLMTPGDDSPTDNERDRCDVATATATKAKKATDSKAAKKPAAAAKAPERQATLPGTGSPLDALTAEDRKALTEVLPRFEQMCQRGVISTICGNDVAAAAVAKLIDVVK